jgi:hypothetical protein
VKHGVVGVPGEPDAGQMPRHPEIERVMQKQIGEQRRDHALNAKDNFRFERTIIGWRGWGVLDLRHKR